jgi:hypothetical protein
MARICELVSIKFGLMFGDYDVQKEHEFLSSRIYPVLGFNVRSGITLLQVLQLKDHMYNLDPNCRIIGLEECDGFEIVATEVWESYGDAYSPEWVEQAAIKFNPNARVSVFVRLPESLWKY